MEPAQLFTIATLGCKVNQYDSAALAHALQAGGLHRGEGDSPADLVVVQTCCITHVAMRKSRQAIRQAVRRSPGAVVLVSGCYSDYDRAQIRGVLKSLGVPESRAIVAGNQDDVAAAAQQALHILADEASRSPGGGKKGWMSASESPDSAAGSSASIRTRRLAAIKNKTPGPSLLGAIERFDGHQRAFVKVQDGCDAFCSYCVVPYTRPNVRSRPAEQVLAECRRLVEAGHREIVLCGVFLGAYGRQTALRRKWDASPPKLPELLRQIAGIDGLWRVRLSSLEPGDVTEQLLAAARELPNFAPHFHLPLQSGSGQVLSRMNRQYTPEEFLSAVRRIRAALDRPALTTDILVGFAGEGEQQFGETLCVAREAAFSKIHAFPFSPIRGTAGWLMRGDAPPPPVVRRRMNALAELEAQMARSYRTLFVGDSLEAVVESGGTAMTDRYFTVHFEAGGPRPPSAGEVLRLRITGVEEDGARGEPIG